MSYLEDFQSSLIGSTTGPSATGGAMAAPVQTTRYEDVGNDNGRGPGTPGGRGVGTKGPRETVVPAGYDTSPDAIAQMLASMPPEKVADAQRKMVAIGLLPENFRTFGFVDSATRTAFTELLDYTNRDPAGGDRWDNTLDGLARGGTAFDEARMEREVERSKILAASRPVDRVYESANPLALNAQAEAAFREALGRKPSESELAKFRANFDAQDRAAQSAEFDVADRQNAAEAGRQMAQLDAGSGSESEVLMQRLQRFIADAPGKIGLGKTTRSYEEQVRLYNAYKAGKGPMAAKPGTSKHGDGRANDLKYESEAVRQWALANAGRYGLAFPIHNPKLGRGRDESWHVEVAKGSFTGGAATPGAASAPVVSTLQAAASPGDLARDFARKENPVEAGAYDIGQQFQTFIGLLGGVV